MEGGEARIFQFPVPTPEQQLQREIGAFYVHAVDMPTEERLDRVSTMAERGVQLGMEGRIFTRGFHDDSLVVTYGPEGVFWGSQSDTDEKPIDMVEYLRTSQDVRFVVE